MRLEATKRSLNVTYYLQIVSLLILGGDIETNPGPGPSEIIGGKVIILANHCSRCETSIRVKCVSQE